MPLSIPELKKKWEQEESSYEEKEVGTGAQIFVKDMLLCPEIFGLKRGLQSTKLDKRNYEFIEEETKRGKRRADIVIFIDPEVVIPVEVEKLGNLRAGLEQLLRYQLDWEKQYGLLTDGYTWRFYNNNAYREFTLDELFKQTDMFKEFWKEYTKSETYYLSLFEDDKPKQLLAGMEELYVENTLSIFFDDITHLINSFRLKLDIEGYFSGLEKKDAEKKSIEISYAYIIQFILYKTLVDNEFSEFKKKYENILAGIYKSLQKGNFKDVLGFINRISFEISENIYRPFSKEQSEINKKLVWIYSQDNKIAYVSPWLDIIVFLKKYNFSNIRNDIFGYVYENYLKELYEQKKRGQYFTDPNVVDFMLDQVGYNQTEIKKRMNNKPEAEYISIIDPACGSGTFLYNSVNRIISSVGNWSKLASKTIEELVNENVFGLDIAEFPLYLAEMNILMRMLPIIITEKYNNPVEKKIKVFKTKDSISEFLDTNIKNTFNDADVEYSKNGSTMQLFKDFVELEYESFVRDSSDIEDMKKSLENHKKLRRRFDFIVANPPYVAYNECSKQGVLITKLIQNKKVLMSDIYGVNLNTVQGRKKAYAPKPNLFAFFIALGLALLKDNGKLCFIIPQTMLTANDLDVIRFHLAKYTTIEKIILFRGRLFVNRGISQKDFIPTSSLIIIVKRRLPDILNKTEVINFNGKDEDVKIVVKNIEKGKYVTKRIIPQKDLLQNISNWSYIKFDTDFTDFYNFYKKSERFDIYRLPEIALKRFASHFYFDKGLIFPKNKILNITNAHNREDYYYLTCCPKGKSLVSIREDIISKEDIRLPGGAQGFCVFDKKYKIIWQYMNYYGFYFSEDKIMLNHNWVIISSDNRNEMLYILSLLNSNVNSIIISKLLKIESEKALNLGIKFIKEFIRVPKITSNNEHIKNKITFLTNDMLLLENTRLSDLVDFSSIKIQQFDSIEYHQEFLTLCKGTIRLKCNIMHNPGLVHRAIFDSVLKEKELFKENNFNLNELMSLSVFDKEKHNSLKNLIDDLVFALYFNANLSDIRLDDAIKIKAACQNNKYYKILSDNIE